MSDPNDPFGRRDRTIIRPNPGGRRPDAQPGAPRPGAPPGAAPPGAGWPAQPPPGQPPMPPARQPAGSPASQPFTPPPPGPARQPTPPPNAPSSAPTPPPQWPQQPPPGYPGGAPGAYPQPGYPPQPGGYPQQPYGAPPGYPQQGYPYQQPGAPAWAPDQWIPGAAQPGANPYQTSQQQYAPLMPNPGAGHVRAQIEGAGSNPLMKSAAPLLLLLGRLRSGISRAAYAQLMDQVAQAIIQFEREVKDANVPPDTVVAAKYAVCATADDIVQNMPSDDRAVWTQYSMLGRFFSERTGGVTFFTYLDKARKNPAANIDLLELMHACLALGFEGVHRTSAGGQSQLQTIRRDVYEAIRRIRSRTVEDLSPHWRGQSIAQPQRKFRLPVWSVAAVAGVLLLGVYIFLRSTLAVDANAAAADLTTLHPRQEIAIVRPGGTVVTPAAAPPAEVFAPSSFLPEAAGPTQIQRIEGALAEEIDNDLLSVQATATAIVISIGNVPGGAALFDSGSANVTATYRAAIADVASALENEPGPIRVVGHTDNVPLSGTGRFASNFELSVARADAVGALLRNGLSNGSRVQSQGRGEDAPIAANDTAAGRALNRRVEIVIERTG